MAESLEIEPNAKGFESLSDCFFRVPAYDERYKKVRAYSHRSAARRS